MSIHESTDVVNFDSIQDGGELIKTQQGFARYSALARADQNVTMSSNADALSDMRHRGCQTYMERGEKVKRRKVQIAGSIDFNRKLKIFSDRKQQDPEFLLKKAKKGMIVHGSYDPKLDKKIKRILPDLRKQSPETAPTLDQLSAIVYPKQQPIKVRPPMASIRDHLQIESFKQSL